MTERSIEVGDSRPEYRLTRDNDSGDLKIEFLWTNKQQRSDKGCTEEEAKEIRDALIELYPLEEDTDVTETVEYKIYPQSGRNEDGTYDVFRETRYSDGKGCADIVARFWDAENAAEYAVFLSLDQALLLNKSDDILERLEEDEDRIFERHIDDEQNHCAEVKMSADWENWAAWK